MKAKPNSLIIYLLFSIVFLFSNVSAFTGGWKLIPPETGRKVKLKVNKKTRTYWRLEHNQAVKILVNGPSRIKVYSRAVIPAKKKETLYGFEVQLDDGKPCLVGRGTAYKKTVKNIKHPKLRIGESRSVYLKVPEGKHEYTFTLPKMVEEPVFVRFYVENHAVAEKPSWIAYLPRTSLEEVRISVKEREYIYYRAAKGKYIELDIIGPTRVRGIARLEFDASIRGEKAFRVQVSEDDKVLMTAPLTAKISGTASYTTPSDKVLGKGETFYIDVPAGHHHLKVTIPDPGISVLFRFYLPQKDLSNEIRSEYANRGNNLEGPIRCGSQ